VKVKQSLYRPGQAHRSAGVFVAVLSVNKTYTGEEKCFDDKMICDFSRINGSKYSP
jgi:hypothetical protein